MKMESCHLKKHLICFNIFYQNGEYIIFLFVIRHFEQYVFSKINAIEGCLLNIRQELETLLFSYYYNTIQYNTLYLTKVT